MDLLSRKRAGQKLLDDAGLAQNLQGALNLLIKQNPLDPYAFVISELRKHCLPPTIDSLSARQVFAGNHPALEVTAVIIYEGSPVPFGTCKSLCNHCSYY